MPQRIQIYEIDKLVGRTVFFDANVFLYIFWPTGNMRYSKAYSKLFNNCLQNNIPIAIDFIVLSEVINRALRIEHEKYIQSDPFCSFKKYRDSPEGIQSQNDVYEIVTQCLKRITICGKEFTEKEILSFLTVDSLDFNDKGIADLCVCKGYILATNDGDFSNQNIDIISANVKIQ